MFCFEGGSAHERHQHTVGGLHCLEAQLATANAVIEAQSDVLGWYMEECAEGDAEPPAELQELMDTQAAAEAARKPPD